MRAGLIIGGFFLMVFGAILFLTIIFFILGILAGLVGFIMLIVGLVTSPPERVIVQSPANVTTTVYAPPPPEQRPINAGTKYCAACGTPNSTDTQFCKRCGKKFLE